MPGKSWLEMTREVYEVNCANGWWDKEVSFHTAMALLHSEVSEILDAWRKKGMEPWFVYRLEPGCPSCHQAANMERTLDSEPEFHPCPIHLPKPEGVPSEAADVLIRLIDDCDRYAVPTDSMNMQWVGCDRAAERWIAYHRQTFDLDDVSQWCNKMHDSIAITSTNHENSIHGVGSEWSWARYLQTTLTILYAFCRSFNIDLEKEYEQKLAYNRTREYRHGNRRV